MDLDNTVELIPVSQWVYNLYKVSYYTGEPTIAGSRLIRTRQIASASENHLDSAVWEHAPYDAQWANWEVVKENVGSPRIIGSIHGLPLHEDALTHGERIKM